MGSRERWYKIDDDMPMELLVGDALDFTITVGHPVEFSKDLKQDWVGIYPKNIPTLPGLSHRRWKYLSTSQITVEGDERKLKVIAHHGGGCWRGSEIKRQSRF